MAVNDFVVLDNGTDFIGEIDSKGHRPMLGIVESVGGGTSTVVWENLVRTTIPDSLLQKVFSPNELGPDGKAPAKWIQMTDFPAPSIVPLPDSTPKSPAASGICVQAYGLGQLGNPSPDAAVAILAIEDGRQFMRVIWPAGPGEIDDTGASREDPGRRTVLHDG